MIVYRVEHPESGLGPYHHEDLEIQRGLDRRYERCPKKNPLRGDDFYDVPGFNCNNHGHYLSGFLSEKDMKEWFGRYFMKKMLSRGFVVNTYEINSNRVVVSCSKKQVVFLP